eukprot:UN25781
MMSVPQKVAGSVNRKIITVKERQTGLLVQEKVPTYVNLAIRLMYNSRVGRAFSQANINILNSLSERQGRIYDSTESVGEIEEFIKLHNINTNIIDRPLDSYKTFNDFFARGMKKGARPVASPNDNSVVVSPADCRFCAFESISDCTQKWVKGSLFTLKNLFGKERWEGGLSKKFGNDSSMCIARLSPQDYHRWHMPFTGKCTKITPISGALYTVNPIAINQPVDVYTHNKRCIVEWETNFGSVVMCVIAAT